MWALSWLTDNRVEWVQSGKKMNQTVVVLARRAIVKGYNSRPAVEMFQQTVWPFVVVLYLVRLDIFWPLCRINNIEW